MAALLPGVMPWHVDRLSPRQVDALLAGALWREERTWDMLKILIGAIAASQGGKYDVRDEGSRVPGYRIGD